ncbi:MAG: ATP-grasp domain-containing protein, partial [Gemmatimonadota bacterium]
MAQPTILCMTSFDKGADFMRECKAQGARVLLLTLESLAHADWPRESIDDVFMMPALYNREHVFNAVGYLARTERFDRIVALDEFDVEMAAALREHLRLAGMNESITRFFRDKLAMRVKARASGIRVPAFTKTFPYDDVAAFLAAVPPPWVLKPRMEASAVGIKKFAGPEQVWQTLETMGDAQANHLIEQFVRGDVYHVDAIVIDGKLVLAEKHRYHKPPFEVYHGGGLFRTSTLERGSAEDRKLHKLTQTLAKALGSDRGILHTEFIRGADDGAFYFLETAARVGGASINEMVEAAAGVNLWREWAKLELAAANDVEYKVEREREEYGAVILSLARQQW